MKKIIELKNVSKVFQTDEVETYALKDVDLEVFQGDYVSISGPSGGGKSTLLSILGLLDEPSSGRYFLAGEDVSNLSLNDSARNRCENIGFVFQSFNLIDEISVFDNVALPLVYSMKGHSSEDIKRRVMECLEKVEIAHRANHKPNQLSGGQQQRVAIARALVAHPAVLLVDEPTGNLDTKNGDQVMALLEKLNSEGTTICMVTHDPRYAGMAKRKVKLLDGQIVDTQLMHYNQLNDAVNQQVSA